MLACCRGTHARRLVSQINFWVQSGAEDVSQFAWSAPLDHCFVDFAGHHLGNGHCSPIGTCYSKEIQFHLHAKKGLYFEITQFQLQVIKPSVHGATCKAYRNILATRAIPRHR